MRPTVSEDARDVGISQLAIPIALTLSLAALSHLVFRVVGSRPRENVIGIDAAAHIATVKAAHAFWHGAVLGLPENDMSRAMIVGIPDTSAVTVSVKAAHPQPASAVRLRHDKRMVDHLSSPMIFQNIVERG